MIIDIDTRHSSPPEHRSNYNSTAFATVMTQCLASPLFAPWNVADPNMRSLPAAANASLNTHPATSSRREGRHTHR